MEYVFLTINLMFAFLIFFMVLAFITGAPFVPTGKAAVNQMISFSKINNLTKVCDLGSGDGRLLFLAAQKGATATGLEINPYLVLLTRFKKFLYFRNLNIKVYWKNFWNADFGDYDIIYLYLIPWRMDRLEAKIIREAKPNVTIISNSFMFPNLKLIKQDKSKHIFVYNK
jgi:SAM-dependent methyltransferase